MSVPSRRALERVVLKESSGELQARGGELLWSSRLLHQALLETRSGLRWAEWLCDLVRRLRVVGNSAIL